MSFVKGWIFANYPCIIELMNPSQTPGTPTPGSPPVPPAQNGAQMTDIPEEGFGFADTPAATPQVMPVTPPRPAQLAPTPLPAPLPAPIPIAPAPPITPIAAPQPTGAVPQMADVMPPQKVPAVPTLNQVQAIPAPAPVVQPPAPISAPQPPVISQPSSGFDPSAIPVHASSTPESPIASFSTPVTHLPEDIANRISEHPMQNSSDIMRQVKHGIDGSRIKGILSLLVFAAGILVAAFLINQFIFQSYYVEGTSMTPTLQNNDRLIISKVEHTLATIQGKPYIPNRGQIVVLDSSIVGLNGQKEQLIKRVVGLPGERIHIESGTVIITNAQNPNGFDVTKQLGLTNLQATYSDGVIDITVPQGQVYVMGDNREQGGSYDSRSFGPIDGNKIQGRLWARILPLENAQLF
jgi:signal peptidase I